MGLSLSLSLFRDRTPPGTRFFGYPVGFSFSQAQKGYHGRRYSPVSVALGIDQTPGARFSSLGGGAKGNATTWASGCTQGHRPNFLGHQPLFTISLIQVPAKKGALVLPNPREVEIEFHLSGVARPRMGPSECRGRQTLGGARVRWEVEGGGGEG